MNDFLFRSFMRHLPATLRGDIVVYQRTGSASLVSLLKHPPFWVQITYRLLQYLRASSVPRVLRLVVEVPLRGLHLWLSLLTGIEIPIEARIAPGLHISHTGGVVISPLARIGVNCFIGHGTTIGLGGLGEKRGAPILGRGVYIGAGARIIGKIVIGDAVAIGANAVVTKNVPDNAIVAGVPARILSYREPEPWLLEDQSKL